MALSFNAPVTCGSTKAEVLVNNPKWFDVLDVSVVDGFNEKIQMNLTPPGGRVIQLGPPVGKLGNQKVFGVFPYACTICAGIKDVFDDIDALIPEPMNPVRKGSPEYHHDVIGG